MLSPARRKAENRRHRIQADLEPVIKAEIKLSKSRKRFAAEIYLKKVYDLYERWHRKGLAERNSNRAAKYNGTSVRRDSHPLRIIIDVTCQSVDLKQRSRWVRALQFAEIKKVKSNRLRRFVRENGGIAGCARKAALATRSDKVSGG